MRDALHLEASTPVLSLPSRRPARAVRVRALLLALLCVGLAHLLSVSLLLEQASNERAAIEREATTTGRAAAQALDYEAVEARALLLNLARSASLREGRLADFTKEAAALLPPASFVMLIDEDGRQILCTTAQGTSVDEMIAAARRVAIEASRGAIWSDARVDLISKQDGLSLIAAVPLTLADGQRYALALVRSAETPMHFFAHHAPAPGWVAGFVGPSGPLLQAPIAGARSADASDDRRRVAEAIRGEAASGGSAPRSDIFVTYTQSKLSPWSAAVAVPASLLAAPRRQAMTLIATSGGIMLLLGASLALFGATRIASPYREGLAVSEERFRALADTVPDILFTLEQDRRCSYANRRFYDFTKTPTGTGLDFGWMTAVHPDDRDRALVLFDRATKGETVRFCELRLQDGDGAFRWFLVRLRPVPDAAGAMRWFGSATEIDHFKRVEARLRDANAHLAAVLAGIDECYCTVDQELRITSVNEGAADWVAKEPDEIVGRPLLEVVPSLSGDEFLAPFREAMQNRRPLHLEYESRVKPGHWLEIHGYPWADGLSVFFRDITRRKIAEHALRGAQALLQGTMNSLSAAIAVLDAEGIIIAANAAWQHFADRDNREDARCRIGSHYLAACQAIASPADVAAMCRGLRAVVVGSEPEFRMHYFRRLAGREGAFQLRATRFEGDGLYVVVAHEDVTEVTRTEAELQQLAGRILRVQDEERRRIARDLHDTTVQSLVAALMSIDCMRSAPLDETGPGDEAFEEVRGLISGSIQELRTLSYLLHPPLLEELGLASALKWFIQGFERRSGIAVEFEQQGELGRLPAEVENAFYRIVQEALTNVHRHSGSATAEVLLWRGEDECGVEISDAGRGIADGRICRESQDSGSLGVGISGMRMRLRHLGGALEIRSAGIGTKIIARVPLSAEGAEYAAAAELARRAV